MISIARGILLLLIGILPWWFAGVRPLSQLVLACGLSAATLPALVRWKESAGAWRATWPMLMFLLLAVALGGLQLSEQVGEFVAARRPEVTAIVRLYASDVPLSEPRKGLHANFVDSSIEARTASLPTRPISLDPAATRRNLALLICAAAAFALGAVCFAEPRFTLRLLFCLAGVASAVSFFGLLQRLSWNGLIYWSVSPEGGQPFGPFINRNNGGGFLEIGFAAALGLLIWQLQSIPPFDQRLKRDDELPWRTRPSRSRQLAWILAHLSTPLLASGAAVLLIFAGVLATNSRGTVLSVAIASAIVFGSTIVVRRHPWSSLAAVGLLGLGAGLVVWLGQSQPIVERVLNTVDRGNTPGSEPRIVHWATALKAVPDYWLCGTGLGAYRYGYARYQRVPTVYEYFYAENQYLDALLSAGVGGLFLLVACLLTTIFGVVRLVRQARSPTEQGIAVAALGMLAAGAIHSCFDFALYTPACFVPFAACCGAFLGRAFGSESATDRPALAPRWNAIRFCITVAIVGLFLGGTGWSCVQFYRNHVVREAMAATDLADGPSNRENIDELDAAIQTAEQAVGLVPDDAELLVRLANLWSDRYTRSFRRELRTMPIDPAFWRLESTWQMHDVAQLLARTADDAGLAALRSNRLIAENLVPALSAARRARAACPLSTPALLKNAVLGFVDESPRNDVVYLDRAERLAGGFAPWWFDIGLLHLHAGRLDRAFAAWRTSLEMSPQFEFDIVVLSSGFLTADEMLRQLVPQNPEAILRVAQTFFKTEDLQNERTIFGRRAAELLAPIEHPTPAQCRLRATAEKMAGNLREAAKWYSLAADREAVNAEWYYDAALAQFEIGEYRAARENLDVALMHSPLLEKYRKLGEQIDAAFVKPEEPSSP